MFNNLVESHAKNVRRPGVTVLSFVAHYGLVLSAIYTSAQAATLDDGPKQEKITFVDATKEPPPKSEPPPELVAAPLPPRTAPVLVAPIEIPSVLPDIDLKARVTDPNDFRGDRPSPSSASNPQSVPVADGSAYFDFQVEKAVMQAPNSASPAYPDILRQAGIEGEILVSFVVDTSGRVEISSFKVIRTTHELFTASVRNALPRMRFIPAEMGTKRVRQLVQQPFAFAIVK